MTAIQLIVALQALPPNADVRVRAACCSYPHAINELRLPTARELERGADVIIDSVAEAATRPQEIE